MNLASLRSYIARNEAVVDQVLKLEDKARLISVLTGLVEAKELTIDPEELRPLLKYLAVLVAKDIVSLLEE